MPLLADGELMFVPTIPRLILKKGDEEKSPSRGSRGYEYLGYIHIAVAEWPPDFTIHTTVTSLISQLKMLG